MYGLCSRGLYMSWCVFDSNFCWRYTYIYYSLVFFFVYVYVEGVEACNHCNPPIFFFLLLLLSFIFSLRSLHKLQTRIRIGIKRCLVCTYILANEDLLPFFFFLLFFPYSTTRRTVMFVHFVLKKRWLLWLLCPVATFMRIALRVI